MIEVELENLRRVRIHWDWVIATLPKEAVKRLAYEPVNERDNTRIILEMDYLYVKSHFCQMLEEGKPETEETILQALENKDIWELEIQKNVEWRSFLELPTNRKEIYASEEIWAVEWDAPNLCENHTKQGDTYCIEWKTPTIEEVAMTTEEWKNLLKKGDLSQINDNSITLGMTLFDCILLANLQEDSIWKRVEQLAKEDGKGEITFPEYEQRIQETRRKIHTVNRATSELLSLKRGYQHTQITEKIHEIEITIQNAKNHAHHWNLNWICVPYLTRQENKEKLEQVILAGEPNADTSNYFSRTILITENPEELAKWLLEFYRKIYGKTTKIQEESLVTISLEELNQYWYEAKQKWRLL